MWISNPEYAYIARELFEVLGGPEGVSVFLGPDAERKCHKCGADCRLIFVETGELVDPWIVSDYYDQWERFGDHFDVKTVDATGTYPRSAG